MDLDLFAQFFGLFRQNTGVIQLKHRLGQIPFHRLGQRTLRGVAQHQNGQRHTVFPQLRALVHRGHRQIVTAQFRQTLGHRHRAMAVGVGLHHAQKPASVLQHGPQRPVIMLQRPQVDLRPGALFQLLHMIRLVFF